MLRFILTIALALCLGGPAWAVALTTSIAEGGTLVNADGTYTQVFQWSFNADNAASSEAFDYSKCKSMTRAFDASIDDASTDGKYTLFACDASTTDRSQCSEIGGPYSGHSATAMGAGMFTKPYGMVFPSTPPTASDVARVTFTCTTDGYRYNAATSAWEEVKESRMNSTYFNDFQDATDELDLTNRWTDLDITAGTVTVNPSIYIADAAAGGAVRMLADGGDNEGNSMLLAEGTAKGKACVVSATSVCYAEARVLLEDADSTHWILGLFEDDDANPLMTVDGTPIASKSYVAFHYDDDVDTAATPTLVYAGADFSEATVTPTGTVSAMADGVYRTFAVKLVGDDLVYYYINGAEVGSAAIVSDITAPLYLGFASVESSADNDYFQVDYVRMDQSR